MKKVDRYNFKPIPGLWKASKVLSKQAANIVLDRKGFRRGVNPLPISPNFTERVWQSIRKEVLFPFREQSPQTIQAAFKNFLSGTASLVASFKAAGIDATSNFVRVLLVAPYYIGSPLSGPDRIQPQKGLERIAFYLLRTLPNVDVMVYNPNLFYSPAVFEKPELERLDIIGFGTLDPAFEDTCKVILDFNRRYPNSLKILGGIAASHMGPQKVFQSLPIDLIIRGQGENPMREIILSWHEKGEMPLKFKHVPGLVLNVNGEAINTSGIRSLSYKELRFIANGDYADIPLSDPDRLHGKPYWVKTREYLGSGKKLIEEIGLHEVRLATADYCRRECIFCSTTPFQKRRGEAKKRIELNPKDIIQLIKRAIKRHPQIDSFQFDDDDFVNNKNRIVELCKLILKSGLAAHRKMCKARIDVVDNEILKLMKAAGFSFISYGVESFSERILKELKKKITPQQIEDTLNITLAAGITPGINLILFNPFTTVPEIIDDIEKSLDYLKRGAVLLANARMDAYHGAPIMAQGEWIQYKKIDLPDMKAPFYVPAYVTIHDQAARELYEKTMVEKENFIKAILSDPSKKTRHLRHALSSIALFYGVRSALGMPPDKLAEIKTFI